MPARINKLVACAMGVAVVEPMSGSRVMSAERDRSLYLCVAALALCQLLSSIYLYLYIGRLERRWDQDERVRCKRDIDNAVLASDETVEFFKPTIRDELVEREKNTNGSQDHWVWLTSYSRIPVSSFTIKQPSSLSTTQMLLIRTG